MKKQETCNLCPAHREEKELHNKRMLIFYIIFWSLFVIATVAITAIAVLKNSKELHASSTTYTIDDVKEHFNIVKSKVKAENDTLSSTFGLDIELSDQYQVYSTLDGTSGLILYAAKFNGETYVLAGNITTGYTEGLLSLFEKRNNLIKKNNYSNETIWSNGSDPVDSNISDITIVTQTPIYEPIEEGLILERGGYDETLDE